MGDAIREARESRGQSQMDVAFTLKCHVNSVCRWETGKARPRGYYLRQLQAAYPELAKVG